MFNTDTQAKSWIARKRKLGSKKEATRMIKSPNPTYCLGAINNDEAVGGSRMGARNGRAGFGTNETHESSWQTSVH
jgi:hypothetical protein